MKDIDNERLKDLLRELMFAQKVNQSEAAGLLGVHPKYLSDMLNGRVPITDKVLTKIYGLIPSQKRSDTSNEIESFLKQLLDEKDKRIGLLEANTTLLNKHVSLLEEKITRLENDITKKEQPSTSAQKSATRPVAHIISPTRG